MLWILENMYVKMSKTIGNRNLAEKILHENHSASTASPSPIIDQLKDQYIANLN